MSEYLYLSHRLGAIREELETILAKADAEGRELTWTELLAMDRALRELRGIKARLQAADPKAGQPLRVVMHGE